MTESFFFGPSDRQIFATYHPSAGGAGHVLTVICPPVFSDFARSQPALREVAVSLAVRGQHVLRFDYRGTGDSYGDFADVRLADLVEDIALCVAEGQELFGEMRIRLLGVRLSALLIAKAVERIEGLDRVVLWDPVVDGAAYLRMMRDSQVKTLEGDYYLDPEERRSASEQFGSYFVSRDLQADIASLNKDAYGLIPPELVVAVATNDQYRLDGVRTEWVRFDCKWDSTGEDRVMPQPVLERAVKCLG